MRDLAQKVLDGDVELDRVARLSDDEIVRELTLVRGIGRWTAEMFLMFQLGRLDVWPVDPLLPPGSVRVLLAGSPPSVTAPSYRSSPEQARRCSGSRPRGRSGWLSSSNRTIVEEFLDAGGLRSSFAVTVSSEEVARGKPAPDVYLAAAVGLRAEPDRCVAIEDSTNGIAAAAAAVRDRGPRFPTGTSLRLLTSAQPRCARHAIRRGSHRRTDSAKRKLMNDGSGQGADPGAQSRQASAAVASGACVPTTATISHRDDGLPPW